jgi:phosphate transport system substrate-binding protein
VVSAVEAGEVELVVSSLEPPAGWFATPLGSEAVAFAVHPSNPVRGLSLPDLRRIYAGQSTNWSEFGGANLDVVPVIPLRGDELREAVAEVVMGGLRFTTNALLAPTPEASLALIREHPGAIAILPLVAGGEGVRLLAIEGIGPDLGDERYPLRLEVLGYAPEEPAGVVREWLAWLQAEGG